MTWKDRASELGEENTRLRQIISTCAASIGNGAHIDPKCSVEFMSELPNEIGMVTGELRDLAAKVTK